MDHTRCCDLFDVLQTKVERPSSYRVRTSCPVRFKQTIPRAMGRIL